MPWGESGYYIWQLYDHAEDRPAATLGGRDSYLRCRPGAALFTDHIIDAKRVGPYNTSPIVRQVSDATFLLQDGSIGIAASNPAHGGSNTLMIRVNGQSVGSLHLMSRAMGALVRHCMTQSVWK